MSVPTAEPTNPGADEQKLQAARAAIESNPVWYHTIELAPGVVTPGFVDHRPITKKVLPDDLSGKRCLDVGTFDGYWAFSMEERGGSVVALDLPSFEDTYIPPNNRERLQQEVKSDGTELGRGFRLVHGIRESNVQRVEGDFQNLKPDSLPGPFDVIFVGAILLHVRDPVGALEGLRQHLAPGGQVILLEAFSRIATLMHPRRPLATFQTLETPYNWWVPNVAGIRAWLLTAGYENIERKGFLKPPAKAEMSQTYVHLTASGPDGAQAASNKS